MIHSNPTPRLQNTGAGVSRLDTWKEKVTVRDEKSTAHCQSSVSDLPKWIGADRLDRIQFSFPTVHGSLPAHVFLPGNRSKHRRPGPARCTIFYRTFQLGSSEIDFPQKAKGEINLPDSSEILTHAFPIEFACEAADRWKDIGVVCQCFSRVHI
jgi:hypothetical protein